MSKIKTFADQIVRLDGWTKEEAVYEIMSIDGISEYAATERYEQAQQRLFSSLKSASTKKDLAEMAIKDAQQGFVCYSQKMADKYKTYRTEFSKEINRLGGVA